MNKFFIWKMSEDLGEAIAEGLGVDFESLRGFEFEASIIINREVAESDADNIDNMLQKRIKTSASELSEADVDRRVYSIMQKTAYKMVDSLLDLFYN